MRHLFLIAILSFFSWNSFGQKNIRPFGFNQANSIVKRVDGKFDVTCMDGATEIKTAQEVQKGEICEQFSEETDSWNQTSASVDQGYQFCSFDSSIVKLKDQLISFSVTFHSPCKPDTVTATSCHDKICVCNIGNVDYLFDFSADDALTLTRSSDNAKFVFER